MRLILPTIAVILGAFMTSGSSANKGIIKEGALEVVRHLRKNRFVDLTHRLHPGIPTWTSECGFKQHILLDHASDGVSVKSIDSLAGAGTHMDSPSHFFHGSTPMCSFPLGLSVSEGAIIDIEHKVRKDEGYFITADDILGHEAQHGDLGEEQSVFVNTGWWRRWKSPDSYRNTDPSGHMVFPGISAKAGELLLERGVKIVGIDTLSPDGSDHEFPFHKLWLGHGHFIIENLTFQNGPLGPRDSIILCLPQNVEDASEASSRVVAVIR